MEIVCSTGNTVSLFNFRCHTEDESKNRFNNYKKIPPFCRFVYCATDTSWYDENRKNFASSVGRGD